MTIEEIETKMSRAKDTGKITRISAGYYLLVTKNGTWEILNTNAHSLYENEGWRVEYTPCGDHAPSDRYFATTYREAKKIIAYNETHS